MKSGLDAMPLFLLDDLLNKKTAVVASIIFFKNIEKIYLRTSQQNFVLVRHRMANCGDVKNFLVKFNVNNLRLSFDIKNK